MAHPPAYGECAPYGISPQIDEWLRGDPYYNLLKPTPDVTMVKAKKHISKVAPTLTAIALRNTFCSRIVGDWFGLTKITRGFGLVSLPFSIIGDIFKAPLYSLLATATTIQAAFGSINAQERAENEMLQKITNGYLLRFEATLMILIKLGLETPTSLYQQFHEGNLGVYMTLTFLFTAMHSCGAPRNYIYLAIGKSLSRDECPSIGRPIFDHVSTLKDQLILTGVPRKRTLPESALLVERWLPDVVYILKNPDASIPETSSLCRLFTSIRGIQQCIREFPIGKEVVGKCMALPVQLVA